ncbi:MAG: methylglyoxal reductase (NADPH-dependent) gre2 [Caeruleum heppii]|nr:MAG: methylglyoxal reductase (NADPH-dependent) gre2 [Caeruleum heppii]
MTRVLLTGGSGFIAAHVLEILLEHGHSVVTTVRSEEKAAKIRSAHSQYPESKLSFSIVPDIAVDGAFDTAVQSDPPFEAVIHTASPFHFNVQDVKKDLLDPAIIGTTGILKAIKKNAPEVRKVVITSSFASIIDGNKGTRPGYVYSEKDWNPITQEEAVLNPSNGYRGMILALAISLNLIEWRLASKTFAERAAWEFLEKEKPNFTITTMCPPLVLGPIIHYLNSLDALNTSNQRVRNLITGQCKTEIPPTGTYIWVDVRDLALAHVKALEVDAADNKRFFVTTGLFSNREIADIIRKRYPALEDKLPPRDAPGGGYPEEGVHGYDNSRTKEVLGIEFRGLEPSIVDLVKSLQEVGA